MCPLRWSGRITQNGFTWWLARNSVILIPRCRIVRYYQGGNDSGPLMFWESNDNMQNSLQLTFSLEASPKWAPIFLFPIISYLGWLSGKAKNGIVSTVTINNYQYGNYKNKTNLYTWKERNTHLNFESITGFSMLCKIGAEFHQSVKKLERPKNFSWISSLHRIVFKYRVSWHDVWWCTHGCVKPRLRYADLSSKMYCFTGDN